MRRYMFLLIALLLVVLIVYGSRQKMELHSEIEIAAPAEIVWEILLDFEKYPDWNPFIRKISGEVRVGSVLEVYIHPPDAKKGMTFNPTIINIETDREFRWLGRMLMPGLFDGEHFFIIKPSTEGKLNLVHGEKFKGLMLFMLRKSLEGDTHRGFIEMNQALKARAESGRWDAL